MVRPDDVGVEVCVGTVVLHDETVGSVEAIQITNRTTTLVF